MYVTGPHTVSLLTGNHVINISFKVLSEDNTGELGAPVREVMLRAWVFTYKSTYVHTYNVTVLPSHGIVVRMNDTFYNITGLNYNTDYTVTVYVSNSFSSGNSNCEDKTFTTRYIIGINLHTYTLMYSIHTYVYVTYVCTYSNYRTNY